jgi:membrane protein implicated in regulation of membrane protease activity
MRTLTRYTLLQLPSWCIATIVLLWLWRSERVPLGWTAALLLAWVVKDYLLYPLLRSSYETAVATGARRLIGETGVARDDLTPRGYVFVRGELWRAEVEPGGSSIPRDSAVPSTAGTSL